MSPEKLSQFPETRLFVGAPFLSDIKSSVAALAVQHIATWSYTELALTRAATRMMRADFVTVHEMLQTLRSARRDAIKAAARAALPEADHVIFERVMQCVSPVEKQRNKFAHHAWALCPEKPDCLVLIDPKYLSRPTAEMEEAYLQTRELGSELHDADAEIRADAAMKQARFLIAFNGPQRSEAYVYTEKELRQLLRDARRAHRLVVLFGYTVSTPLAGEDAIAQLRSLLDES